MKRISLIILMLFMGAFCFNVDALDVARIGEAGYETISSAIENAQEGDEIVILSNLTEITIPEGKNITIDASNYTIKDLSNYGTVTIKNGIFTSSLTKSGIINKSTGVLIINGSKFLAADAFNWPLNNSGVITIKNAEFTTETGDEEVLKNAKSGTITIENATATNNVYIENLGSLVIEDGDYTLNNITNKGTLTINGGSYSSNNDLITNTKGETTINNGNFNSKTIVENYDPDYLFNNDRIKSITTINNGEFISTDVAFENTSLCDYCEIYINGGIITSNTVEHIISEFSGSVNNIISINGGEIIAEKSEGFLLYGDAIFSVGVDDGDVSITSPKINIKAGYISGLGIPNFKFYDGKIILASKIGDIKVDVPTDYYIKYDANTDSTFTAYLVKNIDSTSSNDDTSVAVSTTGKTGTNSEVKNPKTGTKFNYIFLIILIITCMSMYLVLRRKTRFPKHN